MQIQIPQLNKIAIIFSQCAPVDMNLYKGEDALLAASRQMNHLKGK